MTQRFGIDTSILVRLATGEPEADFESTVAALTHLVERDHAAIFVANMVVGEAYIALQHHYGVPKPDAKSALSSVLSSGLVAPSGGQAVLDALASRKGCGLMDRLIALQYAAEDSEALTLDRKMAALPNATLLSRKMAR